MNSIFEYMNQLNDDDKEVVDISDLEELPEDTDKEYYNLRDQNLYFRKKGNCYSVRVLPGSDITDVVIPSEHDGLPVKVIEDCAFYHCKHLTNVTIPDSIETVGYCSFSHCTTLKEIVIPDSVKKIESSAFDSCSSLKSITIGHNVKLIESNVFGNCTSLTDIIFKGTKSEWNAIVKEDNWYDYIVSRRNLVINCTDGIIKDDVSESSKLTEDNKSGKCILCGSIIEDMKYSNDAYPVAEGRCCNKCNYEKVIPARVKLSKLTNNSYLKEDQDKDYICKEGSYYIKFSTAQYFHVNTPEEATRFTKEEAQERADEYNLEVVRYSNIEESVDELLSEGLRLPRSISKYYQIISRKDVIKKYCDGKEENLMSAEDFKNYNIKHLAWVEARPEYYEDLAECKQNILEFVEEDNERYLVSVEDVDNEQICIVDIDEIRMNTGERE